MFVLTGQATATDGTEHPAGEIHSFMLFVDAADADAAQASAVAEAEGAGWSDVRLHRVGEMNAPVDAVEDETMRNAYASALSDGAALVIYRGADERYAG